ncbi:MAG: hypothetical protein AABZ80_03940 [Gemmatimonadota bacterium]
MQLAIAALVLLIAAPGQAQSGRCAACAARSDSAFVAGDGEASLNFALEGLRRDSNDLELLWRAARSEIAIGIVSGEERRLIDAHLVRAIEYSRRAVALAPNEAGPHFWLAAALGRLSLRVGFRRAVPLASEAYTEASRALAIDSMQAGAHEIIGKLHSEVRKLPWLVRRLVASLSNLEVARHASWEEAEYHLKKSIAIDPSVVLAWADLSQLYLRTGRRLEAIAVVEALERRPRLTPADAFLQDQARRRLGWYR